MSKSKQYLLEIHHEIGLLRAAWDKDVGTLKTRLLAIEQKQDAVLKVVGTIDVTVVKRLAALVDMVGVQHEKIRGISRDIDGFELDRGMTASALNGLTKRISQLERCLVGEPQSTRKRKETAE